MLQKTDLPKIHKLAKQGVKAPHPPHEDFKQWGWDIPLCSRFQISDSITGMPDGCYVLSTWDPGNRQVHRFVFYAAALPCWHLGFRAGMMWGGELRPPSITAVPAPQGHVTERSQPGHCWIRIAANFSKQQNHTQIMSCQGETYEWAKGKCSLQCCEALRPCRGWMSIRRWHGAGRG